MATAAQFVAKVESQIGVPYKYGGDTPAEGFDCSGLIYWACGQLGIPGCPRTSQEQWAALGHVTEPFYGCLVFFDVPSDGPSQPGHVGVYLSPNRMVDAPETGEDVSIQPFPFVGGSVMGYASLAFTAPPLPPQPSEENVKQVICNPGPGQDTWLVNFELGTKLQLPTEADVEIAAWAGAEVNNGVSPAQLALLRTVTP